MGAEEKKIVKRITEAVSNLPGEKREFILGYAEGVIAMADQLRRSDCSPVSRTAHENPTEIRQGRR